MDNVILNLNKDWKFAFIKDEDVQGTHITCPRDLQIYGATARPAIVPGSFLRDLQNNWLIKDPMVGTNSWETQKFEDRHVYYFCDFTLDDPENAYMDFEGLDTLAEVFLNGELIGKFDNMLIPHTVKPKFNKGKNTLLIHFLPVVTEAKKYSLPEKVFALDYNRESLIFRKAAHMYGWDIMPRLVSCGIWKEIYIKREKSAKLTDTFFNTVSVDTDKQTAEIHADIEVQLPENGEYEIRASAKCGSSIFAFSGMAKSGVNSFDLTVGNCKYWMPRPYGEPNLYEITVSLVCGGRVVDENTFNFGIRKIELSYKDFTVDGERGDFCFVVNGRRIFTVGTNWVPLEPLHSDDKFRLDAAIKLVDDIGCNMIRCWGGNVYECDEFFDYCDKLGILVWQDFAFACAVYPDVEEFNAKAILELESIIRRLRGRTCLANWAGDNEGDLFYVHVAKFGDPNNYRLTREIIPSVLDRLDPSRPYIKSSPYYSTVAYENDLTYPEDHLWGPRDWFKGEYYGKSECCFASETGYHGCNSPESMRKFLSPEHFYPDFDENDIPNDEWVCHSAQPVGGDGPYAYRIKLMYSQVEYLFGEVPGDISEFAKCSQISQGEACKYFIERFRIRKGTRNGLLWWNIVDGWPQFSDAVVDFYYCKKLAYHYIKRSQQPLCLMFDEPIDNVIDLYAVSEFDTDKTVTYKVTNLMTNTVVCEGTAVCSADKSTKIDSLKIADGEQSFLLIKWSRDGENYRNHYFTNLYNNDRKKYMAALKAAKMDEFEGF